MSSTTLQDAVSLDHDGSQRQVLLALALSVLGLAIIFVPEETAAIHVWTVSTAYSHCFFVLPITLYLAWTRRDAIAATPVAPTPAAAALALPIAIGWIIAERLGIMEGRQLAVICLVQVLFLTLLGPKMWRTLSVPLLYLFFLVPFGAFITPALQNFTARFVVTGLNILGIPNFADDFEIDIPEGNFYVAEACAGLRFLIASVAFGVLYSCLLYRSPKRRLIFIGVSIVVPIVANGMRALGIVVLGHIIGSAEAAATDHIIYGWVFFSTVILLLVAGGLPFRQDHPATGAVVDVPEQRFVQRGFPASRVAVAATAMLLLSSAGPLAAALLDRAARVPVADVPLRFQTPATCEALDETAPALENVAGASARSYRYMCDGTALTATVVTFPPRANPAKLTLAQRDATGEDRAEDALSHPLVASGLPPAQWRATETGAPARVTASSFWINGTPAQAGIRGRALQALHSIVGARVNPVLVSVSLDRSEERLNAEARGQALTIIASFLRAQTTLDTQLRSLSAPPGR